MSCVWNYLRPVDPSGNSAHRDSRIHISERWLLEAGRIDLTSLNMRNVSRQCRYLVGTPRGWFSLLAIFIEKEPAHGEHWNAQKDSSNSPNFTSREEDQERMELDTTLHQIRRQQIILYHPIGNQETDNPTEMPGAPHLDSEMWVPPPLPVLLLLILKYLFQPRPKHTFVILNAGSSDGEYLSPSIAITVCRRQLDPVLPSPKRHPHPLRGTYQTKKLDQCPNLT